MNIDFLKKAGCLDIIMYLDNLRPRQDCLTGIMEGANLNSSTATSAVTLLLSDGLLSEERGKYNTRYLTLTNTGKKVARILGTLESMEKED